MSGSTHDLDQIPHGSVVAACDGSVVVPVIERAECPVLVVPVS